MQMRMPTAGTVLPYFSQALKLPVQLIYHTISSYRVLYLFYKSSSFLNFDKIHVRQDKLFPRPEMLTYPECPQVNVITIQNPLRPTTPQHKSVTNYRNSTEDGRY